MSTYFIVLLCSIAVPFASSFEGRLAFYTRWKYFFPSVFVAASLFVVWDVYFTKMGVWGFNSRHLQGWYLFNLPVEEILFFIIIPYCCTFLYEVFAVEYGIPVWFKKNARFISYGLLLVCVFCLVLFHDRPYPLSTFGLLSLLIVVHLFVIKADYLGQFYFAYMLAAVPFFLVNGVLTGSFIEEEVVWYNAQDIIGFRIGTVPFEDYFYGMALMLLTQTMYEWLKSRSVVSLG
jgi:lycopene cyclase domain-containing protein